MLINDPKQVGANGCSHAEAEDKIESRYVVPIALIPQTVCIICIGIFIICITCIYTSIYKSACFDICGRTGGWMDGWMVHFPLP